jgi:hypothetical protein
MTSQLGAPDVVLDADLLDAVDRIVPPGTNLNPGDAGYVAPAIADAARRRRPGAAH